MNSFTKNLALWVIIGLLVIALFNLFQNPSGRGPQTNLAFSDFLAEVKDGRVRDITIQGNTDERGSEEYNLALGERRATAVTRYLVDLGVPGSRLRTVSFGEAKPAVPGHDESAWRYNRRSDFSN